MTPVARRTAFAIFVLLAISLPLVYLWLAPRRSAGGPSPSRYAVLRSIAEGRRGVLFRSTVPDASFGKVVFAPLDTPAAWEVSDIACDRLYFQGGRGICEVLDPTLVPPYAVFTFDRLLQRSAARPLTGVPNRARVSPDGRRAAVTVFESGHSYAEGGFSTRTSILDAATGERLGDLEQYAVTRDGVPFAAVDFNFWGVTFGSDGDRFYATLRTQNVNYLVEGSVDGRTARVVHAGVECPSLSPDGRRLAFKKRLTTNDEVTWQVAILELDTMRETTLTHEKRSVDDQVDWLDDAHVVYHLPKLTGADVWALAIDGRTEPRLLIDGGYSPSVMR